MTEPTAKKKQAALGDRDLAQTIKSIFIDELVESLFTPADEDERDDATATPRKTVTSPARA